MTDHVGPRSTSIEQDFRAFHAANPHVYAALVRRARQWAERHPGRRLGIKMLFEVLRWDAAMATGGDGFKLNNNYHSYYARLIMEREPFAAGLFELRRLHVPAAPEPEVPTDPSGSPLLFDADAAAA